MISNQQISKTQQYHMTKPLHINFREGDSINKYIPVDKTKVFRETLFDSTPTNPPWAKLGLRMNIYILRVNPRITRIYFVSM